MYTLHSLNYYFLFSFIYNFWNSKFFTKSKIKNNNNNNKKRMSWKNIGCNIVLLTLILNVYEYILYLEFWFEIILKRKLEYYIILLLF